MATLEEEFAALPGSAAPSLEAEFDSLPTPAPRETGFSVEKLAADRAQAEAEASAAYLKEHPFRASAAAFAQQFAKTSLPFVGEALIKHAPFGPGLTREQQEELAAASPTSSLAGTATGVVGAVASALATGGASAEAQLAGRAAASTAAASGAGRLGQVLAAVRGTATAPVAAGEAAAPLMSLGSRLAGVTETAITTAAPTLRTGIIGRTISGAVGGGISAGALGAINEAVEAQIENRPMAGENIVSNMKLGTALGAKIGGAIGAVESLAPAARWFANTESGRRIAKGLGRSRAEQIYQQHAPDVLSKVQKQISPEESHRLINEAADQGLVGAFKNPVEQITAVREAKSRSGELIGRISAEADAARNGAPVDVTHMWDAITDKVIDPLSRRATIADEEAARDLSRQLERLRNENGNAMTLGQIAKVRSEIDDLVFGARPLQITDPSRTTYYNGLRQFRHALTDAIGKGVQESGIDQATWRAAQRQYQVVSHAERVALKSMNAFARSSGIDGSATVDNLLSLGTLAMKGVAPGLGVKLALSGARYVTPRVGAWARNATERALRNAATPPAMIANLRELADEQTALAEGRLMSLSLRPEDNARTEFLSAYDRVNEALDAMQANPSHFSRAHIDAARQARSELEAAYAGLRPPREAPIVGTSTVLGPDGLPIPLRGPMPTAPSVEQMGDAIERARDVFAGMSQPTAAAGGVDVTRSFARVQQPSIDVMRGLRDDFTGLLADTTGMWGPDRLNRARNELLTLHAAHTDPVRLARLQAIQDEAHRVQRDVVSRADRLMGTTGAATQVKRKAPRVVATPELEPEPTAEDLADMGIEVLQ